MFCVHHDEADAVGVETVPCPFCGFGASPEESYPEAAQDAGDDSHDALVKAMALTEEPSAVRHEPRGLVNLRHYW